MQRETQTRTNVPAPSQVTPKCLSGSRDKRRSNSLNAKDMSLGVSFISSHIWNTEPSFYESSSDCGLPQSLAAASIQQEQRRIIAVNVMGWLLSDGPANLDSCRSIRAQSGECERLWRGSRLSSYGKKRYEMCLMCFLFVCCCPSLEPLSFLKAGWREMCLKQLFVQFWDLFFPKISRVISRATWGAASGCHTCALPRSDENVSQTSVGRLASKRSSPRVASLRLFNMWISGIYLPASAAWTPPRREPRGVGGTVVVFLAPIPLSQGSSTFFSPGIPACNSYFFPFFFYTF